MRPITEIIARKVPDAPRTRSYQERLDRALEEDMRSFDLEKGLLMPRGRGADFDPAELMSWEDARRREAASQPEWLWYYEQSRGTAAHIGRMAFCYMQPLSKYHADPRLLAGVRNGLKAYTQRQAPSGEFIFCPVRYATIWGTHEMAWRLEPLIYAYVWMGEVLPEPERAEAYQMIERAADFLLHHPNRERCNRGCVWSAIVALCGLFLQDESYLRAARENWETISSVLDERGQVLEGSGPDSNYSFTAVSYIYLYRLFSDDASLDEPLVRSLKWFARMRTASGYPFEGMSTRKRHVVSHGLVDLVALMERYARQEPFFLTLVDRYLTHLDRHGLGLNPGHACAMYAWAMMEHDPHIAPAKIEPEWYRHVEEEFKGDLVWYVVMRRNYQTAITLRAPMAMKGLQTWAYGDEPPIVHPGMRVASSVQGWALDTAAMQVSARPEAANWPDRIWGGEREAPTLSIRQESLWTHYVFTPVSTIVLFVGETGRRVISWCINRLAAPEPQVKDGMVIFDHLRGRLFFLGAAPAIVRDEEPHVLQLQFEREELITPFALSDDSFRLTRAEAGSLGFADSSGEYEMRIAWNAGRSTISCSRRT